MTLNEIIRKHALKNAYDYGEAKIEAIIGKVLAEFPEAKNNMKETIKLISKEAEEINKMRKYEIESELQKYTFIRKKPEQEKKLTVQNAVQGKVVTRFAPEPSGYPHIGHAKAAFLNYEIAKAYKGKLILRFDDTNPEKESEEYVNAIKEGLKWLGISWDKESYTSDSILLVYEYAEKAISENAVYVCTCTQEQISENREKQKPCACRNSTKEETLVQWKRMCVMNQQTNQNNKKSFEAGEAIMRLKANLSSLNTVMRDPTLFRIVDAPHYRQRNKYRVWPTYDFATPIMDSCEGITHAMRSKEYELRNELYFKIIEILKLRKPELVSFSRLAIKNAPISKRLIAPLVAKGKVMGYDDPRLLTLKGLAKKGIHPEAIRNFVRSFGFSKVESEPGLEKLLAENRKLIEPEAKHYFFVPNPIKLKIMNAKPKEAELKLHPNKEMGVRKISVNDFVYIASDDFEKISEGEVFRLKGLYNVKLISKKSCEAEIVVLEIPDKKIQWVADCIETKVLKPGDLLNKDKSFNEKSMEIINGYAEKNIENIKDGEIIQFERFGFCRLDKKAKKYTFIYSC